MSLQTRLTALAQSVGLDMAKRPPVVVLTQAAYDALAVKDPKTLYLIVAA